MKDFKDLFIDLGNWSDEVFGQRKDPLGPLHHLKEEVDELIQDPQDDEEYADALMLLLDAYRISGGNIEGLLEATRKKLEKNRQRTWGEFDENGVSKHIKK